MHPERRDRSIQREESGRPERSDPGTTQDERFVSGRFLSDDTALFVKGDEGVAVALDDADKDGDGD